MPDEDVRPRSSSSGNPLPIGHVSAGSTDRWAVISDHQGRVYATRTDNAFRFVQSYNQEEFIGTPANQKVITTPHARLLNFEDL